MSVTYNFSCDQGATLAFSTTWLQSVPSSSWTADTVYGLGDVVAPVVLGSNGFLYTCTTAGISDATEPTWPITLDTTVDDGGSVVWTCSSPDVAPVDLTSYTAYMSVGTSKGVSSYFATVTTTPSSNGLITLGGAEGTIAVAITGETTLTFDDSPVFYDLFVVSPTDVTTMLLTGKITVNGNVTVPVYE